MDSTRLLLVVAAVLALMWLMRSKEERYQGVHAARVWEQEQLQISADVADPNSAYSQGLAAQLSTKNTIKSHPLKGASPKDLTGHPVANAAVSGGM